MFAYLRLFYVYFVVILFSLSVSCASTGRNSDVDYGPVVDQLKSHINQGMSRDHITGLSIALVDEGSVAWAEGFGYSDLARGVKADSSTLYEIGSISKTMTAAVVMRLVERGLMDLDRPLADYLPGFSINQSYPDSGPITIRTLMTHHSGIPGDVFPNLFSTKADPGFRDWMVDYVRGEYTSYPVDYRWAYSNTAVFLLGEAAAAVSGKSLTELGDELLQDLGMLQSSFTLTDSFRARLSKSYYFNEDSGRFEGLPHFYCNAQATGGVYSTVMDMALYIRMVLESGSPAVSPSSFTEMTSVQNENIPLDLEMKQGLNWFLSDSRLDYAGQVLWHGGDTVANHSVVMILPEKGLGVVVISNSNRSNPLVNDVARLALELAVEAKTGLAPPKQAEPEFSPVINMSKAELSVYEGVYPTVNADGYDVVAAEQNRLLWTRGDGSVKVLVPRDNGWFSDPDSQALQVEFADVSGRFIMIGRSAKGCGVMAQRFNPVAVPASWIGRTGKYKASDLPATDASRHVAEELRVNALTSELIYDNGLLLYKFPMEGSVKTYILNPLNDARAVLAGLGRAHGGSIYALSGGGESRLLFFGVEYTRE